MIATVSAQGGATWAVLQYLLGFRALGYDVWFVESVAASALTPVGSGLSDSDNARYFRHVASAFGFGDRAALSLAGTRETIGVSYATLRAVARRTDLLVNIAGMLTDRALTEEIPVRVYLDVDPGFTQLWQTQGIDMRFAGHTHFATFGQAIGAPGCPVPTCGIAWIPTRPPVVLSYWPPADRITHDALTTVAHWRGYGAITADGILYGQKAHSLRQFIATPTMTHEAFLLALAIHPDEERELSALARYGWRLLDPAICADTPARYQAFIAGSKGEFGIAKSGYVAARCGWFSDRSVCYLASGRPVIAQETGFSAFLPTGEGLFAFATQDELLACIATLNCDYARHSRAARSIARDYFDARIVLARLLAQVGVGE